MTNHRVDRAVPISTSRARSQSLNQCTINCHKTGAAPGTNSFMAARMCHDSVSPGKSRTEPVTSKAVCLFTVAYLTTVSPFSVSWHIAMVDVVCCYRLSRAGGYIPIISFLLVLLTFFALSFLAIIDRHHSLSFCNENRVAAQEQMAFSLPCHGLLMG